MTRDWGDFYIARSLKRERQASFLGETVSKCSSEWSFYIDQAGLEFPEKKKANQNSSYYLQRSSYLEITYLLP